MRKANDDQQSLHYYAAFNDVEPLRRLLTAGLDIEEIDLWRRTPLMVAAEADAHEAAEVLLAAGASPAFVNVTGATLFSSASSSEMQQRLLTAWQPREPGRLHAMVEAGCVEQLVDAIATGADVNECYGRYLAPVLHTAVRTGNVAAVEVLVEAGADVTATDKDGDTVLAWCKTRPDMRSLIDATWPKDASQGV